MAATVASKNLLPFPKNFGKIFWNNQFKVKIPLPSEERYGSIVGKVAIVTGANQGLGFEAARQLLIYTKIIIANKNLLEIISKNKSKLLYIASNVFYYLYISLIFYNNKTKIILDIVIEDIRSIKLKQEVNNTHS